MNATLQRLDQVELPELSVTVRNAGIAGAGGAGFPSHAKWKRIEEVEHLLVNHQESEPNFYIDKHLGRERAEEMAALFDALLDTALETVVIGAKETDREEWMAELEAATDATVYGPGELPIDPDEESGIVFAYTDDEYEYGMESVLLNMIAGVVIGQDLPMDYGWIVQNTETLCALHDALEGGEPMIRKYVHVSGDVPRHRFLEVPIGTPATDVLGAAGLPADELADDKVLADGGPGWCFEIEAPPEEFGVRKRTNCILVLDETLAWENMLGGGRINVRGRRSWKESDHETEPTETLRPEYVRIPMISNPAFEGVVAPSEPIVERGDRVSTGDMVAVPSNEGISNAQHASIDGEVTEVTDNHVEIHREPRIDHGTGRRTRVEPLDRIYWTWCMECGEYVIPDGSVVDPREYVCEDCQ